MIKLCIKIQVRKKVKKYKSEKKGWGQKKSRNKHIYLQIKRDTKKSPKTHKKRTKHKTHEKHI